MKCLHHPGTCAWVLFFIAAQISIITRSPIWQWTGVFLSIQGAQFGNGPVYFYQYKESNLAMDRCISINTRSPIWQWTGVFLSVQGAQFGNGPVYFYQYKEPNSAMDRRNPVKCLLPFICISRQRCWLGIMWELSATVVIKIRTYWLDWKPVIMIIVVIFVRPYYAKQG